MGLEEFIEGNWKIWLLIAAIIILLIIVSFFSTSIIPKGILG